MDRDQERAIFEELAVIDRVSFEKTAEMSKEAILPRWAANLARRYGRNTRPMRWASREVAGLGARGGIQGKHMTSPASRVLNTAVSDPNVTDLYETAQAAGRLLGPKGSKLGVKAIKAIGDAPLWERGGPVKRLAGTLGGIKTDVSGPGKANKVRRAADYVWHEPLGNVGKDLASLPGRAGRKLRGKAKKPGWRDKPQAPKLGPSDLRAEKDSGVLRGALPYAVGGTAAVGGLAHVRDKHEMRQRGRSRASR